MTIEKRSSLSGRVERALASSGKFIWSGKHPESEPHTWTREETQAAWDKGEIPPPEFPDTRFGRLDRRFNELAKWFSYLAGIGLLFIVVVLVIDTIGWKLFDHAFPSANDFVKYTNVVAVFFAVAFVQTDRGSMAIELLQKRVPQRAKVGLRTLAWLLGMAVCFYCAYRGVYLVDRHFEHLTRSDPPVSFLIWPFSAAMVIGFILLGIGFVISGIRDIIEFKESRARYSPRQGAVGKADKPYSSS